MNKVVTLTFSGIGGAVKKAEDMYLEFSSTPGGFVRQSTYNPYSNGTLTTNTALSASTLKNALVNEGTLYFTVPEDIKYYRLMIKCPDCEVGTVNPEGYFEIVSGTFK